MLKDLCKYGWKNMNHIMLDDLKEDKWKEFNISPEWRIYSNKKGRKFKKKTKIM